MNNKKLLFVSYFEVESSQSKIFRWRQGCIRPLLSIFERPSTRYIGVSGSMRGVSIAGFWPDEELNRRFFGFLGAKRPKRCQKRHFRKISKIFRKFYNIMNQKTLKLHFKAFSDDYLFVSGRWKNHKFSPGRSKPTFKRPDIDFALKGPRWKQ